VADVIREDNVELSDIERLAGAEENVGKDRIEKRVSVATGPVQEQDRIISVSCGIAVGLAEREVVELQLGEGLAGPKAEIFDDVGAVLDRPLGVDLGRLSGGERRQQREQQEMTNQWGSLRQ
jgi:hypothetical protein